MWEASDRLKLIATKAKLVQSKNQVYLRRLVWVLSRVIKKVYFL